MPRNDLILYQRTEGLALRHRFILSDEQVNEFIKFLHSKEIPTQGHAVVDENEGIHWEDPWPNKPSSCTAPDVIDSI